jgi:hypothetical protein
MAEEAMGVVRQIVATHVGMAQTHLTIRAGRGALTIICPLVRLMLRSGLTSTAARHACATLRLVLGGEADDSKATVAALEAMLAASKGAGYEGQGWSRAFPELRELLHPVVRRKLQASIDAVLASIERVRDAPPAGTAAEVMCDAGAASAASAAVGDETAKAMQSTDTPPTAWQSVAESADDPELALVATASAEAKASAATSAEDAAPSKAKPAYLSFVERQLAVQSAAKAAACKAAAARASGFKTAASKAEAVVSGVTVNTDGKEPHESSLHRFRGFLALAAAAELPADEVQRAEAAFQEAQARRTRERLVRQQAATAEKAKARVGAPAMAPARPAAIPKAAAAAAAAEAATAEAAAAEAAAAEKGVAEAAEAEKAAAEAAAAEKAAAEAAAAEKAAAEAAATEKALAEAAEKAAELAPVEPFAAEPTAEDRGTRKGGGDGFFASLVSLVSHLPFLAPAAAPSHADLSTATPSISPPRARSLSGSRLINPEWDRRTAPNTAPRSEFDGTYLPIGGSSPIFESILRAGAPPLMGWAGGSPGARSHCGSPGAQNLRSAGGADDHLPLTSCNSVLADLAAGGSPLVAPLSSLFSRGAADAHLGASLSSQRKLNLWKSRWEDKHIGHETAMWEAPVRALTALAPALSAGGVPLVRVGSGAQVTEVSLQTLSTIHGLLDDGRPDAVTKWRNS